MQTPSHFLITAFLNIRYRQRSAIPIHTMALLIGSVLPDIPFMLLTLGYEAYYRWFNFTPPGDGSIMEYLHFNLFFNDPIWIISHNFFHSLVINLLLISIGYMAIKQARGWGLPLFWLAISTTFHTVIDVFTHNSDGPLIFFPFNWHYRFASPISYWEVDHYGLQFLALEYGLDLLILGYFGVQWWRKRSTSRHPSPVKWR